MKNPINRVVYVPIFGKQYLKYFPIDLVSVDKIIINKKMKIASPLPWCSQSATGGGNDTEIIFLNLQTTDTRSAGF